MSAHAIDKDKAFSRTSQKSLQGTLLKDKTRTRISIINDTRKLVKADDHSARQAVGCNRNKYMCAALSGVPRNVEDLHAVS
jgi:hypothetical protein